MCYTKHYEISLPLQRDTTVIKQRRFVQIHIIQNVFIEIEA